MRLKRHWAMGFEAGNLVFYRQLKAQVMECLPGIIPEGNVPVVFLNYMERGIVPVPADDLEPLDLNPD